MPVSVIVGGQYGSEGKGKVAYSVAERSGARYALRVGGPNSGHTVVDSAGKTHILHHLPTPVLLPNVTALLPAGSYIRPSTLLREIDAVGVTPDRLKIHPNSYVIQDEDIAQERADNLNSRIGSTETGVGAAVVARVTRRSNNGLAAHHHELSPFICDFSDELSSELRRSVRVVVEGTQGFGLSLLHSPHYPYCTSRDTTASGFISEAGIAPLWVDDVVLVIRSMPIRVAGNSGPLGGEITWDEVTNLSGSRVPLLEHTTVTRRIRRVARFDPGIVRQAITYNCPTRIAMNHLDYIDAACSENLTARAKSFVQEVERSIGQAIDLVGTGPASLLEHRSASRVSAA